MKFNKIVFNKIALLTVSVILGISSVLLFVLTLFGMSIAEPYFHLKIPVGLTTISYIIITFVVLIIAWYLISMRLYSGDRKILVLSFIVLIAVSIVSLNFALYEFSTGPKGKQIPMYAFIFRYYSLDGKLVVYSPWENYEWSFYEPHGYNEKYSSKYKERIYIASFYYKDEQKAQHAFEEYRSLIISKGFNKSSFDISVNSTKKFDLIDSFTFENNDFVYSEFIQTKPDYLPGNYIIVVKSNIDDKQLVKTMVSQKIPENNVDHEAGLKNNIS